MSLRRHMLVGLVLLLVGVAAACSLNPQPYPPLAADPDGGTPTRGDAGGGDFDGSFFSDAAGTPDAPTASPDASDAEAGDASDAATTDAGDAAADGPTDAPTEGG